MSSPFLSSGFDTSALSDGSIQIFASNLGATDLQPGFPCKVNNDQQIESINLEISDVNGLQAALTSVITNPFNGTLEVQNLVTAYDSTPVDLNAFIAVTLNDLSDLNSNTQYITSSLGQTQISSNILTNDIDANNYRSQDGSIFIDMTTPGDVNVSATNFLFNGDPVLTSVTGAFLKLDGTSTMTGDLDMGGFDVINTGGLAPVTDNTQDIGTFLNEYKDIYLGGNIVGSTKTTDVNNIITTPSTSNFDMNNFNITNIGSINKSGTNILIGPGAQPNSINIGTPDNANNTPDSFVFGSPSSLDIRPYTTGIMNLGSVARRFNNIFLQNSLQGPSRSCLVDNVMSCSTAQTGGNLLAWSSSIVLKVAVDSGIAGPDVFIRTGSVPMTGNLNMNSNNITNVGAITTSTDVINIGLTNTTSGSGSVSIGASNTAGGFAGGKSIIYGNNNNTSGSTNGQCMIYGNDNTDSNGAGGSFIYGFGNTNGTGQRNILIGRNNVVPNAVNEAFVMGFANTNSISNSLLVGGASQANIRPGSNNLCSLGILTTNEFSTSFTRNVDTSAALAIAPTSATSLALGRAAINTTILGTAIATVASGAWYSTASFSNAFTAATNRLVNPALTTNALLS